MCTDVGRNSMAIKRPNAKRLSGKIIVKKLSRKLTARNINDLSSLQTTLYSRHAKLARKNIEIALGNRCTCVYVAMTEGGTIVAKGTVCLTTDELGIAARLENIVCARQYRRLGLMSQIVDALLSFAKPWRPYIIHLASHPWRKGAYNFYKKKGFILSGCGVFVYPT